MAYSRKTNDSTKSNIIAKGVKNMPQNPSSQGYTAEQIKKFYYEPEEEILDKIKEIDSAIADELGVNGIIPSALANKQNTISDLDAIRSGASLGVTSVQQVQGKGLSTNDYTNEDKNKLSGIEAGAEVNEIDTIVQGENITVTKNGKTVTISGQAGGGTGTVKSVQVNSNTPSTPDANGKVSLSITKSTVGLGNVENTSDANKPISNATQSALDDKLDSGLKGSALGLAELDENSKVPMTQIPDGILGQLLFGGTVATDVTATLSTNAKRRLNINDATIKLVNSAVGDTSTTPKEYGYTPLEGFYFIAQTTLTFASKIFEEGDWLISTGSGWEKIDNTDAVTSVNGRIGAIVLSKTDVGLGNVGNFKAVSTEASQGLNDTEKTNARTNIGAGTSSFSGDYNDLSNKPTIPTVGNGTIIINQGGVQKGTFSVNQSGDTTVNLDGSGTTDYNSLTNKPILNQDLTAEGFTAVANTYYRHTGTTGTYTQGVIYYYNGTEYKAIDGSGSGGSGTDANAVHYTAETKTDEQKAQARENIGAGTPIIIEILDSTD